MGVQDARPFMDVLAAKKNAIAEEWLARTLQAYPKQTSCFLVREKHPFRNPVGHTLEEVLPALVHELLGNMDTARIGPLLDRIVRIRAVQDFTASQAVGFVFALKRVIREELKGETHGDRHGEGLATLEGRIDEMALLAFDLFLTCREKIYEIKANEAKRRVYLLERMQQMGPSVQPTAETSLRRP